MSVSTPVALASEAIYGLGQGRGDLEQHVIETLRTWIISYVADYERQRGLVTRSLPVPPSPSSIHGGIDFNTFSGELLPELIVVCQPEGVPERYADDGTYGSWFTVDVAAIVTVEGSQDQTRALADAYGTILQKLVPQQGAFGFQADGVSDFAVRTRLERAYELAFPDETVRDIVRATVGARTFVEFLVSDWEGPRTPPANPYGVPLPVTVTERVEVNLLRDPDRTGLVPADSVILDGTVNPPVTRYEETTVEEPIGTTPELTP